MIQRPTNIPRAARFSIRDGWWQVGEVVDGKPFGPWRTFRPDGSPLFEARFDSKGRLQGTFKRFHPDGSLSRQAKYARGKLTGRVVLYRAKGESGDVFPSTDPRAWQVVVDHDDTGSEQERTLLDERGVELVEDRPLPGPGEAGALDPVFATAAPDNFLAKPALPKILDTFPPATPPKVEAFLLPYAAPPRRSLDAKRFQDLYGKPMPPPLRAWLEVMVSEPALFGVRVTRDADLVASGNLVEALIVEHQEGPAHSVGLRSLVSGLIPIGESPDRRLRYCAAVCEQPDAPTDAVYAIAAYEDAIQIPVARTLDDFAYLVALFTAFDRGAISNACLTSSYERLRGRVDLRDPMTAIERRALDEDALEDEEIVGDAEQDHAEGFHFRRPQATPGYFFYRNRWLLRLLCGEPEGAAAAYDPKYDGALDDTRFELILKNSSQPWVAFYWAFRALVFQDARLPKLLAVCSDTPSQLVRDVAALVQELAAGRKKLGAIDDFQAVLNRFRALDPMSNKDDEEADEEEDDDDDGDKAPAKLEVPAELASAAAVIDWACSDGYSRENLLIKDELEAAALGLALRADPAIVPHIANLLDDRPWLGSRLLAPWLDGNRADLAALVPKARDWLGDRESGAVYRWVAAAGVLVRAGTPADAKLIGDVLEPSLDEVFGRGQGFEAAMGQMVIEEAIETLCAAAAKLGLSETVIAALEGVVSADNHLVDDSRGPCALALASVNRGLDAIVAGIEGQLERKHGHRITPGQLEAIGTLGRHEPARIAQLRALIEDIPRISDEAKLGQMIALHDLGATRDLAAELTAMLAKKRYQDDREDAAKKRAAILAVVERRPDLPGELARPYAGSEHLVLHHAAARVLRARGITVPEIHLYDPYHVNQLAARGREQLHAALADERGLYLGNVALWLGDHPDPSSREPLIAFARSVMTQPYPEEGPRHYALRWTVRALIAIGGADAMLDELLRADDRALGEPVLRYADQLGPAVARGMVHVFSKDEHWRQHVAKAWLAKHKSDPRIAAALAERGLDLEDVTRKTEEA